MHAAAPSQAEFLYNNYKVIKDKLKSRMKDSIMEKYGNAATEEELSKELLLGQSEKQVEYDRAGRVVKGMVLDAAFTALIFSTGEQQENALISTIAALEHIGGDLMGKKILRGESIGYLDIAMLWISYWLPIWEEVGSRQVLDPSKFPATISWMTKFLATL